VGIIDELDSQERYQVCNDGISLIYQHKILHYNQLVNLQPLSTIRIVVSWNQRYYTNNRMKWS